MNVTTIIFAHGDAIQTINRHLADGVNVIDIEEGSYYKVTYKNNI